jgi:thiamine kinase-like enzyme
LDPVDLAPGEKDELLHTLAALPEFVGTSLDRPDIERIGGLTNRNYKVSVGAETYVLRLAGAGTGAYIDRKAEEQNARIAAAAGVNAELLHFDAGDGTMLCRWVEAITMSAESFRDLARVGRAAVALRCMHECATPFVNRFDVFAQIDEYLALLRRNRARIPEGYDRLQQAAERARAVLAAHPARLAPCHNDPLAENFLDTGERMVIVDWEYAGMNDPMWDLGDLAVEAGFGAAQEDALLRAYFGGAPPPAAVGRMVMCKGLCDLVWTLWGLIQVMNDNPVDDFWAYSVNRFERCRRLIASPEFARALAAVEAS